MADRDRVHRAKAKESLVSHSKWLWLTTIARDDGSEVGDGRARVVSLMTVFKVRELVEMKVVGSKYVVESGL